VLPLVNGWATETQRPSMPKGWIALASGVGSGVGSGLTEPSSSAVVNSWWSLPVEHCQVCSLVAEASKSRHWSSPVTAIRSSSV
jgi:hypothetical protein